MINMHNITDVVYSSEDTSESAPVNIFRNGKTESGRADSDVGDGGVIAWLAEGGTIGPYVAPPAPLVTQVTAYQAKIQLSRSGFYDSVVTTVNTSDNPELKIAWEVATTFERNSSFILALQPELGLTDDQVDDLFQQASLIGTSVDN